MRKGFSIAELVIVVSIIGILASLVVPILQNRTTEAKVAAARDNLRLLRVAIRLYAARHGGVAPGYEDNDPDGAFSSEIFMDQTITQEHYLRQMPTNPFNDLKTMSLIGNGGSFPAEATGAFGWIYQPSTETIHLDWPGTDDAGICYYDY
jgi:prepilin-type N-terminal cleavage/methylation domain-containing protein